MAFLTDDDYLAQIDQSDLLAMSQPDTPDRDDPDAPPSTPPLGPTTALTIRARAEAAAQEEAASYLRGRYDMEAAFAATGSARNSQLVMYCVDLALWHLVPRVAFRNVSEVRQLRYEAAIKWLTMAQKGLTNPALPLYATEPDGYQRHSIFQWGSNPSRPLDF